MASRCLNTFNDIEDGRSRVGSRMAVLWGSVVVATGKGGTRHVFSNVFGRRGGGPACTVKLWDVESGACLRSFDTNEWFTSRVMLDDGDSFLCVKGSLGLGPVLHYSISSGECVKSFETNGVIQNMDKIDTSRLVTAHNEHGHWSLRLWNIETGECLASTVPQHGLILSIEILDSERVFVMERYSTFTWNVATNRIESEWSSNHRVSSVARVDSETLLCKMYEDETFALMKSDTGEEIRNFGKIKCSNPVPIGGRLFLCNTGRCDISMYEIKTGRCIYVFKSHEAEILSIVPYDDSSFLSFSRDGQIKVWDCSRWFAVKHFVLLRELVRQGRATNFLGFTFARRPKRARGSIMLGPDTLLQNVICLDSDDIFWNVISYLY